VSTSGQDLKLQKDALIEKAKNNGWDYELFEEKRGLISQVISRKTCCLKCSWTDVE